MEDGTCIYEVLTGPFRDEDVTLTERRGLNMKNSPLGLLQNLEGHEELEPNKQ